jgi:hypothetical protein
LSDLAGTRQETGGRRALVESSDCEVRRPGSTSSGRTARRLVRRTRES